MKNRVFFLLKYYVFWLIFAFFARLLFVLFFWKKTTGFGFYEYCMIFRKGLKMDLSLGGYVILASCVFLILLYLAPVRITKSFFRWLNFMLLLIFTAIVLGDMQVYRVWGYHLDGAVLQYLKTPKEAAASALYWIWLFWIIVLLLIVFGFDWIFRKFILPTLSHSKRQWWHLFVLIIIGGCMILPIRGGLNVSPMNTSFVFFSKKYPFANQAAINPVWNFLSEIVYYDKRKESFRFMEQPQAARIVDSLYTSSSVYPHLLVTPKPNVVVILLESFTANVVGVLGGVPGITPNLDRLADDGILFSQIYATGARSDRGMAGLLSSAPSHPLVSVLEIPKKVSSLPVFSRTMEKNGYSTHFYYGGDLNFFGFRAFITPNFQHVVTENDFSDEILKKRGKWGVCDEHLFDRIFSDMQKGVTPSLYFALTLSSHEPFDVPKEKWVKGKSREQLFLNSVAYTDAELGRFIEKCKKAGLWDNTLFVFVADHGVRYVGNPEANAPESFHIPLVFSGGALSVKDSVVTTIGSQTDVAATLLGQLNIDASAYKYSRNLLADSVPQVAFYANPSSAGVVSLKGVTILDIQGNVFLRGDSILSNCQGLKAYLQTIDRQLFN